MYETAIFGDFILKRHSTLDPWSVYRFGHEKVICEVKVMPSKRIDADDYNIGSSHLAYRVTASNFPGIGSLNQIVKGDDLKDYLNSVYLARGGA